MLRRESALEKLSVEREELRAKMEGRGRECVHLNQTKERLEADLAVCHDKLHTLHLEVRLLLSPSPCACAELFAWAWVGATVCSEDFCSQAKVQVKEKTKDKMPTHAILFKKILLPMFFLCLGSKQGSLNSAAESWNENSWTEAPEDAGTGVMACLCASLMSLHDVNFEIGFLKAYFLQFALSCTSDLSYNFVI